MRTAPAASVVKLQGKKDGVGTQHLGEHLGTLCREHVNMDPRAHAGSHQQEPRNANRRLGPTMAGKGMETATHGPTSRMSMK